MQKIVAWLIEWLTVGPLKGYRTKIIALIMALLTMGKVSGWLDQIMDNETYLGIMGMLNAAAVVTASIHKPPEAKP